MAKPTPKELAAAAFGCSAFSLPKRPWLAFSRSLENFPAETDSKSSGVGYRERTSLEVTPKVSANNASYSGKTWSSSAMIRRLQSPQASTRDSRYRLSCRSATMVSSVRFVAEN